MHPIELAWRRFRKTFGDLLDKAEALSQPWVDKHPGTNLTWVSGMHLARHLTGSTGTVPQGDIRGWPSSAVMHAIGAWSPYRTCKTIYVIDDRLDDRLWRSQWPQKAPIECLRLPKQGAALSYPFGVKHQDHGYERVPGGLFHVILLETMGQDQLGRNRPMVMIYQLHEDGKAAPLAGIYTDTQTIDQAWEDYIQTALSANPKAVAAMGSEAFEAMTRSSLQVVHHILMTVLYLIGEDDVVAQVHPGAKPVKNRNQRLKDLADPETLYVGSVYRRKLERWELETSSGGSGDGTRTVRPHLRGAHFHTYLVGPRKGVPLDQQQRVIRFVLPIPVHGGETPGDLDEPVGVRVT
jgi:hypothetical protein